MKIVMFALFGALFVFAVVVLVIMNMVLNVDICAREHEEIFYDNELDM
jgi:cell division protein FtsX